MEKSEAQVPSREEIAAELKEWDEKSFNDRLARWIFLRQRTDAPPDGWSLPGTMAGVSAWWEAGRSFVAGNFIGTVILTQSFVEDALAEVIRRRGEPPSNHRGLRQMIVGAEKLGEIDSDLAQRLHKLRSLRNPYAHTDGHNWPPTYLKRARAESGGDWYKLSEKDARFAIETAARFIRHIAGRWDELQARPAE
jgi:hypothetical protein